MIYLILAIASSAMISIVMRLSEERVSGRTGMLVGLCFFRARPEKRRWLAVASILAVLAPLNI